MGSMYGDSKLMVHVKQELRKLGLPDNLFAADFWEKEMAARQREQLLLDTFEAKYRAGDYEGVNFPFEQVIQRWKEEIASPTHFASMGHRPRWLDACNDAVADWRSRESGARQESWNKYKRKWRAKRKAQGMPPK